MPEKPACSEWNIWIGKEVEGSADELGTLTLFARIGRLGTLLHHLHYRDIKRVWLCKEYVPSSMASNEGKFEVIEDLVTLGYQVVLEMTPEMIPQYPAELLSRVQIYLKIDVELKDGDFVCVGPAFNDQIIRVDKSKRVKPSDYYEDEKIL